MNSSRKKEKRGEIPHSVLSPRLPTVTKLAIGSLTVSKMQAALPTERACAVLAYAFDRGINFVDTAQYYENYDIIRGALKICADPDGVVLSTKTYAYSRALAEKAVEEARRETGRDVIDIFMLHEQESYDTLRGHMDALLYLLECRERGIIRAVGISTHHVAAVRGLLRLADEGILLDVCHPLYNMRGIGIADGTASDMEEVLREAHSRGVGVFAMKALGGGHLCASAEDALRFVLDKPFIDSVAIGMQSPEEVDANIRFFTSGEFSSADRERLKNSNRSLHVEEYCEGCGACVRRCTEGALSLVPVSELEKSCPSDSASDFSSEFMAEEGIVVSDTAAKYRAVPDEGKCVHCGYCTAVCPVFALKVF